MVESVNDSAKVRIEDEDFEAEFSEGKWTVKWKWKNEAAVIWNNVGCYKMDEGLRDRFDDEIARWIEEGWLTEVHSVEGGTIPLMAVDQPNKNKVRPVLDFRELNKFVKCHTGQSEVCGETMRRWRMMGKDVVMLDLS